MNSNAIFGTIVLPALAFGFAYFPITRIVRSVGVAYPRADLKRRFLAAGVDGTLLLVALQYYVTTRSVWSVAVAAVYLLFRDAVRGRSPGKFVCSLVVVDLETQAPVGVRGSAERNLTSVIPGANVVAMILETVTIIRDPQGQRLGDRFACTQVVDGFGLKELAESWVQWWMESGLDMRNGPVRRPSDGPEERRTGQQFR